MKKLIINADDFGFDVDTCDQTISLIEAGIVTSATLMTGMPATNKAIEFAALNSEKNSFGLHFNIVDGAFPLCCNPKNLVDQSGRFRKSNHQRILAILGVLSPSAIGDELFSQLDFLKSEGVKVSHVDSHGHLHKFPSVIKAMVPVLKMFDIKVVRIPPNLYQKNSVYRRFLNHYCSAAFSDLVTTGHLFAVEDHSEDWLAKFLDVLPTGITELAVHPGLKDSWRRAETLPLLSEKNHVLLHEKQVVLTNYLDRELFFSHGLLQEGQ